MKAESRVEILSFAGCPNAGPAVELAERVVADLGAAVRVERVDVEDAAAAGRLGFLGSPTIRVDGRDVEPGAAARSDFAFCCRVYRTGAGLSGLPDERWLREALDTRSRPSRTT